MTLTLAEAKKRMMDLVAGRDHSEDELKAKMASRTTPDVLDQALAWARTQTWMIAPHSLQEKLHGQLEQKGQSAAKINEKLAQVGLPPVQADAATEKEKARRLVLAKWSPEDFQGLSSGEKLKLRAQVTRFLAGRGFDFELVSDILKDDLKAGDASYDEEY